MKKLFLMLFLTIAVVPMVFGQEPTQPPVSWGEVFSNPALWLGSFAGVSLLTAFVTAFVNGFLKIVKSFPKQLVAWGVAIAITLLGDLLNIKIVYTWDFPWWLALINGLAAGLASNGVFDIPVLKAILDKISGWFKPATP